MKKTLSIIKILRVISINTLLLGLIATSCQKSSTGPKGDTGPAGNANVKATTYQVANWINGSTCWYADLDVPSITSAAQSSGAINVYLSTDNGTNWFALPYTFVSTTNYFMSFVTSLGKVQVQWEYNGIGNGSNPNAVFGATAQFKVVVIPPAMIRPDINPNNYLEVKKGYNLVD